MKTAISMLSIVIAASVWTSCQRAKASYIDLSDGQTIEIMKDEETGHWVDAKTGEPVELCVDTKTQDTIWGATGEVVNNKVDRTNEGLYVYQGDPEYKMKMDGDGDYTVKYGDDHKVKYDDGEYKVKRGDYKKEVEKDGDITIKDGNKKIKIDGETGERKVKYDD